MKDCVTVRIFLAVWDNLVPGQKERTEQHVQQCTACAHAFEQFQSVTRALSSLPETQPSMQVDRVIREAIEQSG